MTTPLQSPGVPVHRFVAAALAILFTLVQQPAPRADGAAQALPFCPELGQHGLITVDDNWSGVPGIVGHRGDPTLSNRVPISQNGASATAGQSITHAGRKYLTDKSAA